MTHSPCSPDSASLRAALVTIADWRKVNISGEYEHGLRDIIRAITDCAAAALDANPAHFTERNARPIPHAAAAAVWDALTRSSRHALKRTNTPLTILGAGLVVKRRER